MNTEITYLYRDADNYKANGAVVVVGEIQYEDIRAYLQDGMHFIPSQVGLDALNGYDAIHDHPYHELTEDDFELSEAKPTSELTAQQVIANFKQAHKEGWDDSYFNETLHERLRDSGSSHVRIPPTIAEVATVTVRMQSDEHGHEDFTCHSWQEAVETLFRLYQEAEKQPDGFERIIGVVINRRHKHGDLLTVYRTHTAHDKLQVRRDDFIWACEQLAVGDSDSLDGLTSNAYILSEQCDFDNLKAFLKEKELLIS
ncbi:hypothetical protein MJD09_14315 [bacterium]|nr:hypothetical protein [bacterium]